MNSRIEPSCNICGHLKSEHHSHKHRDWCGQIITSISCRHTVGDTEIMNMGVFGDVPITHSCSCHGTTPNGYLKRAITKYKKFLRENKNKIPQYKVLEIKRAITSFRESIKENPNNKLWWQGDERQMVIAQ